MNLFEIQQGYRQLAETLIENGGELTPELEEQLVISQEQLQDKAIGYGFVIIEKDSEIEAIDAQIKRLQAMKKSRQSAIDRLKETLKGAMEFFGVTEIKAATLKINFRASESTEISNEALIPERFITVKEVRTIDRAAIKKAIKDGEDVQGAHISYNNNLQIK
jgi:hypothetical protein